MKLNLYSILRFLLPGTSGVLVLAGLLNLVATPARAVTTNDYRSVIIYYDEHTNDFNFGKLYVNQLRNYLGHFKTQTDYADVETYSSGDMTDYDAVFYIGSWFRDLNIPERSLPDSFLTDVADRDDPTVWINYNLDHLMSSTNDVSRFGLQYFSVISSGKYDRVSYKGQDLFKFWRNEQTNYQEVIQVNITNTAVATEIATAFSTIDTNSPAIPYAVRGSNFWFFGDNLFSFDVDMSRSMVFADQLHDILGTSTPTNLRAIVRLEDINADFTSTNAMIQIAEALHDRGIRPAWAVISRFIDPNRNINELMSENREFMRALRTCQRLGGILLSHGHNHTNPEENEISGEGYEFWNNDLNRPLTNDSLAYAEGQIEAAYDEFGNSGFRLRIWETPHYEASLSTYVAISRKYRYMYERFRAFNLFPDELTDAEIETISANTNETQIFSTQYLPYVSYNSTWGTTVLPENLNFFEIGFFDSYGLEMTASNKLNYARQLSVVRDAVASFYFHPVEGVELLTNFIHQLEQEGYTFTDAETLIREEPAQ